MTVDKAAKVPFPQQSPIHPLPHTHNSGAPHLAIAGINGMNPMNSMASKPGTDWASSDSESHGGSTTISGAAQSDTIVIKIDTKTDPNYTFSGPAPNALGMLHEANSSKESGSNRAVVPRSPIPAKVE